jgi:hypothetical protein
MLASISLAVKRMHRTYTYEEPNAIKPADVPRFLDEVRVRYPDTTPSCSSASPRGYGRARCGRFADVETTQT